MRSANLAMVAALLLLPVAASADTTPPARLVSYADLDLSRTADVNTFYGRLNRAAEKVCRPESQSISLRQRRVGERCMADAIAKAVDEIGNIELTTRFLTEYRYYVKNSSLPCRNRAPCVVLGETARN